MKKRFQSFSGRLTRRVVITVLVIMTIISLIAFLVTAAGMLVYSKAHYSDILEKTKGNMASVMSKMEVSSDNILDELSWHLATPELVTETIEYELKTNRHLYGCGIAFLPDYYKKTGRWCEIYAVHDGDSVTVKSIGSAQHDYFTTEWYTKGLESKEGVWSNPYLDKDGAGAVLCTYSRQVIDPKGNLVGVFGADMKLDELYNFIAENVKIVNEKTLFFDISPEDEELQVYCFIIGRDGDYIVHPEKDRILKTNFYDYAKGEGSEKYRALGDAMRAGKEGEMTVVIDSIKSHVYYAPLLDSGWSMGIVVPSERIMLPSFLFGTLIIFLILLGLLITFFICRYFIRKTSKPLIRLAGSAKEVAMGNFDTELPQIKSNDEIRLLRDSFDNMQKSLSRYIADLTETTAQKAAMESELDVARKIQMSMLPMTWPAFPDRKDIDIWGSITPAKAVGGDLYDFCIRDNKLYFCIGDVSGKGVPASLVMAVISSMFRTLSASADGPDKLVSVINSSMSERNESLMFVTFFAGELDLNTGELKYCNAGHNAPVVLEKGIPKFLQTDANIPVGIMSDWKYTQQKTVLSPGSILLLYTDGLTEATRADGSLFGEERVLSSLSGLESSTSSKDLNSHIREAVKEFVGDAEQSDDLTMLIIGTLNP